MLFQKTCSLCHQEMDFVHFNVNKRSKDGLHAWCKPCHRKMEKVRYELIKKKRIQEVRDWQSKNLKKVAGYKKDYANKKKAQ